MEAVGGVLHRLLTTTEMERDAGLWRPDEDDVDGIADPSTSLIYRRAPHLTGDAVDIAMLLIALAAYLDKQLDRRRALRPAHPGEPRIVDIPQPQPEGNPT